MRMPFFSLLEYGLFMNLINIPIDGSFGPINDVVCPLAKTT